MRLIGGSLGQFQTSVPVVPNRQARVTCAPCQERGAVRIRIHLAGASSHQANGELAPLPRLVDDHLKQR
jgi:hypothetical protein